MATGGKTEKRAAGEAQQRSSGPKKAELVERITKALSRLNKDELTELVRKLDEGELDLAKLARPAPGTDGGPLRFGFQERLRQRK
ncbi:MAG: hypothetical protein ICV64_09140 [Thermoleophilia bacterium]|nr:hypothetical protein [Thermoleophilia bacterium]